MRVTARCGMLHHFLLPANETTNEATRPPEAFDSQRQNRPDAHPDGGTTITEQGFQGEENG